MNESILYELRVSETDVDATLARLSGDKDLYFSILAAFPEDDTLATLEESIANKAWEDAFTAAHALKGLAGNLGFTPLFHELSHLVIYIRLGRIDEIDESFKKVKQCYSDIINIINHNK